MDSSTNRTGVSMGFGGYQRPEPARLCGGGCGFYGTAENRGLCSKCYTDYLKETMAKSTTLIIREEQVSAIPSNDDQSKLDDVLGSAGLMLDQSNNPPVVVKKGRCGLCKKKVRLLGFDCRCGDTFCGTHRYPQAHDCGFDFKEVGRILIQMENPFVKADKIVDRI